MRNLLFNEKNDFGERPMQARFEGRMDEYYRAVSQMQLKDRLLWRMLERQFQERTDSHTGGWRGEFWGKLIRGACLVYAYTKDEELYEILTETVKNLIALADDLGRISTYKPDHEFYDWDMWSRKYVMLGLEYYYDICKDSALQQQIVAALERHADYIVQKVGNGEGQIPVEKTSAWWGAINSVSILQPFVKLGKLVKKPSYEKFMQTLMATQSAENFNVFEWAKKDEKNPYEYPVTKAYETISCFEGLLDLYAETGEKEYLNTCKKFADRVLATDFTIVGGIGCFDELFNCSTQKQVEKSEIHKQETCVTVTLMKFLTALYLHTGEKKYVDAIERSFFNVYLGALNEKPSYAWYVVPLFYSYSPVYDNPRWARMGGKQNLSNWAEMGCCVAIGAAGLGLFSKIAVMESERSLTLNFFASGEYTTESGTKIRLRSDYPENGNVELSVLERKGGSLNTRVRFPEWAESVSVKKNGKTAQFTQKDGYVLLGEVCEGDTVEILFEAPMRVVCSQSVNAQVKGLYALQKGAIVLCADGRAVDLSASHALKEGGATVREYTQSNGQFVVPCKEGDLVLTQYRDCGKDFWEPYDISVWLKNEEFFADQAST